MAELITNGGFSGNANGWTVGSGWTYDTNKMSFSVGPTGVPLYINGPNYGAPHGGYSNGDILTLSNDGDGNCQIEILEVDSVTGQIVDGRYRIYTAGSNYFPDPNQNTWLDATGGTGTGAQFCVIVVGTLLLSQQVNTTWGEVYDFSADVTVGSSLISGIYAQHGLNERDAIQFFYADTNGTATANFTAENYYENIYIYGFGAPQPDPDPWTGSITNISLLGLEESPRAPGDGVDIVRVTDGEWSPNTRGLFLILIPPSMDLGDDIYIEEDILVEIQDFVEFFLDDSVSLAENLSVRIVTTLSQSGLSIVVGGTYNLSFDVDETSGLLAVYQGNQLIYDMSVVSITVNDSVFVNSSFSKTIFRPISVSSSAIISEAVIITII